MDLLILVLLTDTRLYETDIMDDWCFLYEGKDPSSDNTVSVYPVRYLHGRNREDSFVYFYMRV